MIPVQIIAKDDQIFQLITLVLVLSGIGLEIYRWKKNPTEKYWIISTLIWLVHAGFFYVFITLDRYTTLDLHPLFGSYTLWSSILRLHIISTFIVLEWFRSEQSNLRKMRDSLKSELDEDRHSRERGKKDG
jgi:hypothetical protein